MGVGVCPFTLTPCKGGSEWTEGGARYAGCGYKETPNSECALLQEVPSGVTPRDWYMDMMMKVARREG